MRHVVLCLLLLFPVLASASDADRFKQAGFAQQAHELVLKNQAVATYLWADIYVAALYASADQTATQAANLQKGLRLELYYLRDIDREDIIEAATKALQQQQTPQALARLKPELDRLHESFNDIDPGDRYALDYQPRRGLNLEVNGKVVFNSKSEELAKAYLGIWLAPKGLSEPLRISLLK
ncbi:MAG: hypothetical protein GAK37_01385 [Pseudomonas sp.]|nr:MAG: hypothetical protein GAK37_01385 [Pseudomonas sp.]